MSALAPLHMPGQTLKFVVGCTAVGGGGWVCIYELALQLPPRADEHRRRALFLGGGEGGEGRKGGACKGYAEIP